jgi:hypothetical protein
VGALLPLGADTSGRARGQDTPMIKLPISEIIRDSFKLAWKYKYLWLFGLFAAGSGNGMGSLDFGSDDPGKYEAIGEWLLAALAIVLAIALALMVIYLILHTISKSALIYNVYQVVTDGSHSLSGGWDFGLKRFWPMLGVTLLQIVLIMAFAIALVLIEVLLFVISLVLGLLSLVVAIPLFIVGLAGIVLTFVYAERFVALETKGVVAAIGDGAALLREQWQPSLMMGLVKLGISMGLGFALFAVGLALMLPAVGLWFAAKPLAIVYGVLVLLPFVVLTTSYFGVFDSAAWTKTFLHLRAPSYTGTGPEPPAAALSPESESRRPSPPMFE